MDRSAVKTSSGFSIRKIQDRPLAGSVAQLRSKFGSSNTTDTTQIFGVSRAVSRSKTFNTASPSQNSKYRNSTPESNSKPFSSNSPLSNGHNESARRPNSSPVGWQKSNNARDFLINTIPSPEDKTIPNKCINNNTISALSDSNLPLKSALKSTTVRLNTTPQCSPLRKLHSFTPAVESKTVIVTLTQQPSGPTDLLSKAEPTISTNEQHKLGSTIQTDAQQISTSTSSTNLQLQPGPTTPTNTVSESGPTTSTNTQNQSILRNTTNQLSARRQVKSVPPSSGSVDSPSWRPVSSVDSEAEFEVKTRIAAEPKRDKVSFTSSIALKMADPAIVDKYNGITDIEELNLKLKETRDFEERRALRAVIRKLRDDVTAASSSSQSASRRNGRGGDVEEENDSSLDLSGYTSEEDLKILLHQTTKYEDKKRIRTAIRDLRKKSEGNYSEAVKLTISKELSTPSKSAQSTEEGSSPPPPPTPDPVTVLRNLSNGALSKVDLSVVLKEPITVGDDDDVLVSPIKHESRTLQRPDGNIQIETYSKHSRTTSQSDVYEKSTKVTKVSRVGDLEISEQDEIITKEKLSLKGSITSESDLVRKVGIKEKGGSQIIEEDISIEKSSHSETTGEDKQSALQVTIVREKYPPRVCKELSDTEGLDGEPLTLECEFETPSGDNDRLDISWSKDGKKVKPDKDISMSWQSPVAKLVISELLHPDDSGHYTCQAKNKHGTAESSAQITVKELPADKLLLKKELSDLTVKDGDVNVTLTCSLSENCDGAEVCWYKNGKKSSEYKQTFDGQTASLVISKISPEDSGEYECSFAKGSLELSSYSKIKVQDIPGKEKSDRDDVIPKDSKVTEDTNNNSCEQELTTSDSLTDVKHDEQQTMKKDTEEISSSIDKCESVLKSTTVSEDKSTEEQSSSTDTPDLKEKPTPKAEPSTTSKPFTKPALKSVPRPGMNRPGGKSAPASARGAMAAFKQMDTANNPNAGSAPKPNSTVSFNAIPVAKHAAKMIKRRAMGIVEIKHEMLTFCRANTAEYENVKIDNFSTSWNNGVAFLALIHHFYPDSFAWEKVDERRRRENFQLAFDIAEKKADIAPLLEVDDMVRMKKPDWKCVFTYVQSFYRKLKDHENNKHTYLQQ